MKKIDLKLLANGQIILEKEIIEINDKSSRTNTTIFKVLPLLFAVIGFYQLYKGIIADHNIILNFALGILLLTLFTLNFQLNFKRTNQRIVETSEIKSAKLRKILGQFFIDIKLKNNSTRRIFNIRNIKDWYVIKSYLAERNIPCLD